MAYAARSDLYLYGVRRGALVQEGILADTVDTMADTIRIAGHGLETGSSVLVRSAAPEYALPAPLTGATYFVIRIDDSTISLATSANNANAGTAIDLTTSGTANAFELCPSLDAAVDAILEDTACVIDDRIPHLLPLAPPYPTRVVSINARLAAHDVICLLGKRDDSTTALKLDALKDLDRYATGVRIRDDKATEFNQSATGQSPREPGLRFCRQDPDRCDDEVVP